MASLQACVLRSRSVMHALGLNTHHFCSFCKTLGPSLSLSDPAARLFSPRGPLASGSAEAPRPASLLCRGNVLSTHTLWSTQFKLLTDSSQDRPACVPAQRSTSMQHLPESVSDGLQRAVDKINENRQPLLIAAGVTAAAGVALAVRRRSANRIPSSGPYTSVSASDLFLAIFLLGS